MKGSRGSDITEIADIVFGNKTLLPLAKRLAKWNGMKEGKTGNEESRVKY